MAASIRWGILSTGRIAQWFVEDFASVGNGQVVAVASRSLQSAQSFASRHGIGSAYGDYHEMLADPDVDVVYIGTPHTLHHQNCLDALSAGKAVLCEKPMTVSPAKCRSLRASAQQTGVYLMEAMWTWFLPAIRKAREWVAEGRIGTLRHIKADFGYPVLPYDPGRREYDAALGGGCLLEMGIYPVALAWLFSGRDPLSLQVTSKFAPNGVEDDLTVIFDYGDATATLATSFRCKLQNWAYIIGDEGYVAIPDFWRASECRLYELDTMVERFEDGRAGRGFSFEAEAVGRDLLAGKPESEIVTLRDSQVFQNHMDGIRALFE